MTPPVAAKASGVAKRRVAARRPAVTIASSDSTSLVWIQIPAAMPTNEIPIAHQPNLRWPRVTPQKPASAPRKPSTNGTPSERAVNGGSVTKNAAAPSTMPAMAMRRGSRRLRRSLIARLP